MSTPTIEGQMPESLVEHEPKFKADAWREFTVEELKMWVHLFTKRAGMRTDPAKQAKDLRDASNYADMLATALAN